MTTVINSPEERSGNATSAGAGVVIGAVIVVLVLVGVIIFSLPYIRKQIDGMSKPVNPTINVEIPLPELPDTIPQTQ